MQGDDPATPEQLLDWAALVERLCAPPLNGTALMEAGATADEAAKETHQADLDHVQAGAVLTKAVEAVLIPALVKYDRAARTMRERRTRKPMRDRQPAGRQVPRPRQAHVASRSNRTRGPDDGSDSDPPEPPPPAEPHGRGDELDRGTYTSRPRATGGDFASARELLIPVVKRLLDGER
jgi:hypothetical protein